MISVPGEHASREARRALALGRHVMLFSDNVSVEDEIRLKQQACESGLLMMGPDCGTAIINGYPLAFANAVRRGPIGVVGASGTGIQEVTSCIHRLGGGVSQVIGTGGRDLSGAVGGTMTFVGIEALAADPATEAIVVVSKPPSRPVAAKVIEALTATSKPCVVHFVGDDPQTTDETHGVVYADTLAGTAETACAMIGLHPDGGEGGQEVAAGDRRDQALAEELAGSLAPGSTLRGLFCGGTTAHEALVLLGRAGLTIRSNFGETSDSGIGNREDVTGNLILDLGTDQFTRGRPHPMIEPRLRNERLVHEVKHGEVGLLLFDLILGFGSHRDPAGVLVAGVAAARAIASARGRDLVAIASITGTQEDPQGYTSQWRKLEGAGIAVMPDNRRAVNLAAAVLQRIG
jgi:succinyl-CoA synthetase alpha subunit